MTARWTCACIAFCFGSGLLRAQDRLILRAYAGSDGRAHVELRDGTEYIAPKEGAAADGDEQQGVEAIQVSEDGRAAGWLVLLPNCCTSYSIPLEVVVYRDGKLLGGIPVHVERPMFRWHFWRHGTQVALLYENLHGTPQFQAQLFDLKTSRQLAEWKPPEHPSSAGAPPSWAQAFSRYIQKNLEFQR